MGYDFMGDDFMDDFIPGQCLAQVLDEFLFIVPTVTIRFVVSALFHLPAEQGVEEITPLAATWGFPLSPGAANFPGIGFPGGVILVEHFAVLTGGAVNFIFAIATACALAIAFTIVLVLSLILAHTLAHTLIIALGFHNFYLVFSLGAKLGAKYRIFYTESMYFFFDLKKSFYVYFNFICVTWPLSYV